MGHIYVAIGTDGLLKVGKSKNPDSRRSALKAAFKLFGSEMVKFQSFDFIERCHGAELECISLLGKQYRTYSGREWFELGDFDTAVAIAIEATEKRRNLPACQGPTPKQIAKATEERRLRRERERQNQKDHLAAHAARVKKRAETRALRRAEIAARLAQKAQPMHTIKPITSLTREERRALAQAAADRGDQIQQACQFPAGTPEYTDFEDDFLRRRHTLLTPCE